MPKAPSMQFYPGDWQRDTGLKLCSLAARGLWAEMMWLMFDGEPFGHLAVKGSVIPPVKLAGAAGVSVAVVEELLAELEGYGVFSRTPEGIIYSRRMVRDAKRRATNALNGGKGGNPHLTGKKTRLSKSVNQKDNRQVIPLTADANAEENNTQGKERATLEQRKWAWVDQAKAVQAEKKILSDDEFVKFTAYWTQAGPNDRKMHFEKQQTFEIAARMITWGGRSSRPRQPEKTAERKDLKTSWT